MSGGRLVGELRQLVAELSLISHAPISAYGRQTPDSGEDIGGKRPPGGDRDRPGRGADVEERAAWLASYQRRTPDYFRRELERCYSERRLLELVAEARETLQAWRRAPLPPGQEPEYGSPQWRRYIAESGEDSAVLASRFFCTTRYINKVRKAMREGGLMPLDKRREEKAA